MPLFSSRRRRNTSPAAVEPAASPSSSSSRRRGSNKDDYNTGQAENREGYSSSPTEPSRNRRDSYDSGDSRSNTNEGRFGRRSGGLFRRRRSPTDRHVEMALANDQTLMKARSKVTEAENAERVADAALDAARRAAREAEDHMKMLEREAVDETQRAKMKQAEIKNVRKSVRGLGRHG
ncbi:hypothetical protein BC827DRAFT_1266220 [Russula dissimulans]|nr:hypothetical protein BC827DRAFT_1266220 [Russula dissimulans]